MRHSWSIRLVPIHSKENDKYSLWLSVWISSFHFPSYSSENVVEYGIQGVILADTIWGKRINSCIYRRLPHLWLRTERKNIPSWYIFVIERFSQIEAIRKKSVRQIKYLSPLFSTNFFCELNFPYGSILEEEDIRIGRSVTIEHAVSRIPFGWSVSFTRTIHQCSYSAGLPRHWSKNYVQNTHVRRRKNTMLSRRN